jgi:hypothetical protein
MSATKLLAGLLSVAFAIAPLVLDRCEASCDAVRAGAAAQAAPSCHEHASSLTAHAASPRAGCGHDHLGGLIASPESGYRPSHAARVEALTHAAIAITARVLEGVSTNPSPPKQQPPQTTPLRI